MVEFYYIAPAVVGIVISLVEMFFVMQDEGGMHPLAHGLHAVPTCLLFTYISMNAPFFGNWVASSLGWTIFTSTTMSMIIIPIVIGLIAAIKVKSAAAIVGGHGSIGEKLPHALIIGALIAAAPFVWPFVAGVIPDFLNR
jgi:hypothetical protein